MIITDQDVVKEVLNFIEYETIKFDEHCNLNKGIYGMVSPDNPNEFFYVGSTYRETIRNRCIMYTQSANGGSIRNYTRGHLYDFVRTLKMMMNNQLRYDDFSRNDNVKRYFLDYWWENGRPYNDGLINFFKITEMINSIRKLGSIQIKTIDIMNQCTWDEMHAKEIERIRDLKPYANVEFQLDDKERYEKHERQVQNVYDYFKSEIPNLTLPIRITYSM